MDKSLKTINIFALAKFQAILGMLIGLLCGVLYSFGGLIIDILVSLNMLSAEAMSTPGLSFGTILAFGALFIMPIIGTIAGFVLGIIAGVLFNLFAKLFVRVNLNFEKSKK